MAPKEVKTSDIYWGAVPFVAIQVIMVALIIAFPSLVSVGKKTDMKENIELNIDMNQSGGGSPGDKPADKPAGKPSDDGGLNLNFSSDNDKPAASAPQGSSAPADGAKKDAPKQDDGGLNLNFSSDGDKK